MDALVWGADLISRHLDTVGDGSGLKDAVGDYSTTPTTFRIENYNSDMFMVLRTFDMYIQGAGDFLPGNYGGVPELTNGISISVNRDSMVVDLTNGQPIIHTCCLSRLFHEVQYNLNSSWEPGDPLIEENWISATWRFLRRHGTGVVLHTGDSFEVRVSDDLTGLTAHRFMVYGLWASPRAAPQSLRIF